MANTSLMKRNWFYILTPCVLVAVVCLVVFVISIIQMKRSDGWSVLYIYMVLPVLIFVIIIDVALKLLFNMRAGYIWLTESIIIALLMPFSNQILSLIF